MDKFSFFSLLIFFCIFSLCSSNENKANSSQNVNETLNNTFDQNVFNNNPFKDFDFGNLIWLDDTNATSEIKKHDLLYLIFYSPWCQHCLRLMPEYVLASKISEEKNITAKFAKVDTSVSNNVSQEFKLEGVPSVFLIYKGERIFYEGELTKESLLKFVDRKLNDDIYKFDSLAQVKSFVQNASSLVLLSTLRYESTALYHSFLNYSKTAQDIEFISCLAEECVREYRQDVVLFKKFDEKINFYTKEYGLISNSKIDSVKTMVGEFGVENGGLLSVIQINMMFKYKKKMLFYFRNSSLEEHTKYDKVIKELGKEFRKKNIYTVVSDIAGELLYENIAQTFNIIKNDLPLLLFYDLQANDNNSEVSIYTIRDLDNQKLNKEYIKDYLDKIFNGKIRKDLFSEPPLRNETITGLKYVIGRTYDRDVVEAKNNVFIALVDGRWYNPETVRMMDIMRNLTKKYPTEEKSIVFAFMDAARNQPRDIDIMNEMPPLVFLYTNTLSEKKVIKLTHQNFTEITQEEVEDFIYENLKWGKRPQNENKEKIHNVEEKKEEPKNQKEVKKDTQTDL